MRYNPSRARLGVLGIAAVAAAAGVCACTSSVKASFTLDLRAVGATGSTVVQDTKHVRPGGVGDVVNFELWGLVSNHDGDLTNDGILSFAGSFLSTNAGPGSIRGDLLARRDSRFTANSSSNGLQTDLDGDGDLDVGSNNDPDASSGFFIDRANSAPDPVIGQELLVGTASLTLSQIGLAGTTDVNFRFRGDVNGQTAIAQWLEDGTFHSHFGPGDYHVGSPVTIAVPEPATAISLAGIGLAATAIRRHGRRSNRTSLSA